MSGRFGLGQNNDSTLEQALVELEEVVEAVVETLPTMICWLCSR